MLDWNELIGTSGTIDHDGTIDRVGILRIMSHVIAAHPEVPKSTHPNWCDLDWRMVGDRGKITKQIANAWKRSTGCSITDDDRRVIGTIARHFCSTSQITYDITDRLDWTDGEFGDAGSCFWWNGGAYRGAVYDANGGAIRVYGGSTGWARGSGRAWIIPVHLCGCPSGDLSDVGDRREYVIFNEYGTHTIQDLAYTLARAAGAQHAVPIWVKYSNLHMNGGVHYLITDRPTHRLYVDHYAPGVLSYTRSNYPEIEIDIFGYSETRYCGNCQCRCTDGELYGIDDNQDSVQLCPDCFDQEYFYCENCNEPSHHYDSRELDGSFYCQWCYDHEISKCDLCGSSAAPDDLHDCVVDYDAVCTSCLDDCATCESCEDIYHSDDLETIQTIDGSDRVLCDPCARVYTQCDLCGGYQHEEKIRVLGDLELCTGCFDQHEVCDLCAGVHTSCSRMYFAGSPSTDVYTVCTGCSTANVHLVPVITRDIAWNFGQYTMQLWCTSCGKMCPSGTHDNGLCTTCAGARNPDYVPDPAAAGAIAHYAQLWRSYVDTPTPAPVHPDRVPIALLAPPIDPDAVPVLGWDGRVIHYDRCEVCEVCYRNRRVHHRSHYGARYDDWMNPTPSADLCAVCVHVPDAQTHPAPAAASDPGAAAHWVPIWARAIGAQHHTQHALFTGVLMDGSRVENIPR